MKKIKISPSILSADFSQLKSEINLKDGKVVFFKSYKKNGKLKKKLKKIKF